MMCALATGETGEGGEELKEGKMRIWRSNTRRVIAAVAISDLAYRLFVRAPLRRALGIEARHA